MQPSRARRIAAALGALLAAFSPIAAAAKPAYRRVDVMVPMRDGVRLEPVLFIPERPGGRWRVLLQRTPYGVPPAGVDHPPGGPAIARLERDGYLFAFQ